MTSSKIKSAKLALDTYKRIRTVQACLGYDHLLPLPSSAMGYMSSVDDIDSIGMQTWTRRQAVEAVLKETEELIAEFSSASKVVEDDMILVNPDQSMD
jgi:hypothetical protein